MNDSTSTRTDPSGWRLGGRITMFLPGRYFGAGLLWVMLRALPVLAGLALKGVFDSVAGRPSADTFGYWCVGAFLAVEAARAALLFTGIMYWPYWWNGVETTLRGNVLGSLFRAPGPVAGRLPGSAGEAVSRLRDDTTELLFLADLWVDLLGDVIFAAAAVAIMMSVDPAVTGVVLIPAAAAVVITRVLSGVIKRYHRAARAAASRVTGFVGELFGGVTAVKAAGAEEAMMARLARLNASRRQAEVRNRMLSETLDGLSSWTANLSLGLVLLLAAPAMRRGGFSVGDLALFTAYLSWLTALPRRLGRMLYRARQASVAGGRLARMLAPGEPSERLVERSPLWFKASPPPAPGLAAAPADRLSVFEVESLTALHGDSGRGVEGVSLRLERGSFTVVTGAVGSGKTTLLRALLGLIPAQEGAVRWNGREVGDLSTFMVPPRVAYAGQVPRLFSATLEENVLLGTAAAHGLEEAMRLAVLDDELRSGAFAFDTVIGPRGMRLSGGQLQRATAARALARRPELLVVDDLSSALDVETEAELWARLAGGPVPARLVVSHRRAALLRADQVVVLDAGRVVGAGPLDKLLDGCPEMRRLWAEEAEEAVA